MRLSQGNSVTFLYPSELEHCELALPKHTDTRVYQFLVAVYWFRFYSPTPQRQMSTEKKMKYGDRVANIHASDRNPTKEGIFVRRDGLLAIVTDGNGKFWSVEPDAIVLVTSSSPTPRCDAAAKTLGTWQERANLFEELARDLESNQQRELSEAILQRDTAATAYKLRCRDLDQALADKLNVEAQLSDTIRQRDEALAVAAVVSTNPT